MDTKNNMKQSKADMWSSTTGLLTELYRNHLDHPRDEFIAGAERLPRVLLAAPSSGSGKTLITCGLLQALKMRGKKVASFKCGPDYIDPMFHTKVIGTPSRNLDTFFADRETVRYLFGRTARRADLSVMEGVMGYYDGVAGTTLQASAYDLADATDTPVILVVNARGMSLSVISHIQGFLRVPMQESPSHIKGVILNQVSGMMYPELKKLIETSLPVKVYGYVPKLTDCLIESRHLGLVTPDEITGLQERLQKLASVMEETVDIDGIIALAQLASPIGVKMPENLEVLMDRCREAAGKMLLRIGVARDEAFCFYYEDNLQLLRDLGAELVPFSPIHDEKLPDDLSGLLIGGGYPELYARALSENEAFLNSIREKVRDGIPFLAECGGFMYLHETMEDMEHRTWPMAAVLPGHVVKTEKLGRFGYINLRANEPQIFGEEGCEICGHEFHYFDSDSNGNAFHAKKPHRRRSWDCMVANQQYAAGFPHLYYYSNPEFAKNFLDKCRKYKKG